jgi:hypothetical protein
MNTKEILDAVRRTHTAVVGKTGSGKTSTEKLLVEEAVAADFRVCVLDTIKSDWWGITSSATGKSPGLPFKILGGPRGHVPLNSSAGKVVGQLVGSGKLPLSIVDMADFEAGGIQRFFVDFAESLWRNVRGVVYLVIEEAHEIAPKEQAGFGKENMSIYWAKKLATGSRTKGIRLIVATQRTQALHNAILGSCETLIAHRMTLDADQEQVRKWLKNTNKEIVAEVNDSLSSLPNGTAWVCSGEAQIFRKVHFPKFKTYDNTATPESDGPEVHVKTAAVDQDELRAIIGDAVKVAEANDVPTLQKRIRQLEAEASTTAKRPGLDPAQLEALEARGFERGKAAVIAEAKKLGQEVVVSALEDMRRRVLFAAGAIVNAIRPVTEAIDAGVKTAKIAFPDVSDRVAFTPAPRTGIAKGERPRPISTNGVIKQLRADASAKGIDPDIAERIVRRESHGPIPGPEQKIIDAIRWWNVLGIPAPSHAQAAFIAGYSHKSGTWATYLSRLRSAGMIEGRGDLALTESGLNEANEPDALPTREALWNAVLGKIDTPLQRILKPIIAEYPEGLSHATAAGAAGYSPSSGTWATYLSRLRSLDLIEGRGDLRAQGWLFP